MKIILQANWEITPKEFQKTGVDSKGQEYSYHESPIITLEYDRLTIGNYVIRLDDPKKLKRALEAMYPS